MGEMNDGIADDNQPGVILIAMMVGGGGEKMRKEKNREYIKSKKIGVPFLAFVFDSCIVSRKSGEKRRKKKRRGSRVRESEERGDEAILSILANFCI